MKKFFKIFFLSFILCSIAVFSQTAKQDTNLKAHIFFPKNDTLIRYNFAYFTWQKMDSVISYHFQLTKDTNFTNIYEEDSTSDYIPLLINGLDWNTKYSWRVKARFENGLFSQWSDIAKFATIKENKEKILLKTPANNAKGVDFSPTYLEWSKLKEATLYWIYFYENEIKPENRKTFFGNQYFYNTDTKLGTKYYWCVAGYDYQGKLLDSTEFFSFTTVDTMETPTILNTDSIANFPFELKWTTSYQAKNYDVIVSKNSDFSDTVKFAKTLLKPNYTIANLNNGETYYAGVRYVNKEFYSKWAKYKFKAIDPTDVETDDSSNIETVVKYFDLNGIEVLDLQNMPSGLYFKETKFYKKNKIIEPIFHLK